MFVCLCRHKGARLFCPLVVSLGSVCGSSITSLSHCADTWPSFFWGGKKCLNPESSLYFSCFYRVIAWHDLAFYNADLYEGMRRMMVDMEVDKKDSEEFIATYGCYFEVGTNIIMYLPYVRKNIKKKKNIIAPGWA